MSGEPVVIVESRPGATVAIGLWLRAGSAHEGEETAGITHLLEHLLFRRTQRRGADAIAELIDSLGGDVDAYTTKESCAVTAHVPADRVSETTDLLVEAMFYPRLTPSDVDTERSVVAAEFDLVQDSPGEIAAEQALRACWDGHPLARPVLGERETVQRLEVGALERFHRHRFTADRLLAVIVGPVEADGLSGLLRGLPRGGPPLPRLQPPVWRPGLWMEEREGLEQVYVNLALPGLPVGHEDGFALGILHQLLGAGNSSRLFRELRDRRGLVYDVGSAIDSASVGGVLEIVFSAPPRNLPGCWDAVISVLEDVGRGGIGDREVELARQALRSGLVLGAEGCDALMEAHAGEYLARGRRFDATVLAAELDAVTPERVRSLARRLVSPAQIGGAICGPMGGIPLPTWLPERAA